MYKRILFFALTLILALNTAFAQNPCTIKKQLELREIYNKEAISYLMEYYFYYNTDYQWEDLEQDFDTLYYQLLDTACKVYTETDIDDIYRLHKKYPITDTLFYINWVNQYVNGQQVDYKDILEKDIKTTLNSFM